MLETDIFKFCSYDNAEIIVSSQLLKFSNPTLFNDPFDCDINLLRFDFNDCCPEVLNELEEIKAQFVKTHGTEILKRIENIPISKIEDFYKGSQLKKISRSSICCFSKDHLNTTLWAHYADNHYGISLIFDLLEEHPFVGYDTRKFGRGPVYYNNNSSFNYLKSKEQGIAKLFFSKSKDWEYEKEYRFQITEESGLFKFNKSFLKGVVFGLRVSEDKIIRFKTICKKFGFGNLMFFKFTKKELNMSLNEV